MASGRSSWQLLSILVQCRRDKKAAKRCCRKLLKGLLHVPRVIITDKIKSCSMAQREMLPDMEYLH
jgi:putative transposase